MAEASGRGETLMGRRAARRQTCRGAVDRERVAARGMQRRHGWLNDLWKVGRHPCHPSGSCALVIGVVLPYSLAWCGALSLVLVGQGVINWRGRGYLFVAALAVPRGSSAARSLWAAARSLRRQRCAIRLIMLDGVAGPSAVGSVLLTADGS